MQKVRMFQANIRPAVDCNQLVAHVSALALMLAFVLMSVSVHAAEQKYLVGAARVSVTPAYPVRLSGFAGRRTESEGVSQPLWAKALAIEVAPVNESERNEPVVIVTLDSLGVRLPMVDEVARRVALKAGLKRERLILTFTHTHCAPKVNGAADNIFAEPIPPEHQAHLDQYTSELTDALEQVVLAALADRQPASLEWAVGNVGFAMNRRTKGGPVDHSLPVMFVKNSDGKVKAVYTTYACHCVTLSHNLMSGDWAGYAQEAIERHFPGCTGLVSIGCGSDQNPSSGVTGGKTEIAEQQGLQIADEIARLAQAGTRPISGRLSAAYNRIALPFNEIPTREAYEEMAQKPDAAGYNAKTQLARMDRGEKIPEALEYPIQTLSFGDSLCMVFLGGEVCVDYAIRLRKELTSEKLWLHGYSNDFGAYIPSERLVKEGSYGGGAEIPYFALPTTLKAGLEQLIVDEVQQQVLPEFKVAAGTNGVGAKSPTESLASFRTHPELKVELVAAEPMIADPVAIDFGPDGQVWVAEMIDYARGVEEEFEPSGQIRVLTDANGDGQYEASTVFLGGLRYPTDVKVWKNGALICDAPDILYAEDTTGDGKADTRRVLFSGFATLNGQARVNSLQWGLDNWLYGSCGLFGGMITNDKGVTVSVTGRDFRMHPDTGVIEPVTGQTQQSRVRDDWGNWFGCDNGTLIRHYPVYDEYARRNPFVAPPATAVYVPSGPEAGRLFPASDLVLFKLSGAPGVATAACGTGIYRDDWLGSEYAGNSFSCEPVNQLVYRQILTREGAIFRGRRADNEQQSEFLTSTDQWFRPVQMRTGPDGAVWIVDMYRYVIEHPRWIPDETLEGLNVFAGQGMGRIYRVLPKSKSSREPLALQKLSVTELAAAIDHPNGTRRDLIHQMLVWKNATDAASVLQKVAAEGQTAAGRLSALCALDGLGCLNEQTVVRALADPHSEVRRHAIRLSEKWLGEGGLVSDAAERLVTDEAFEVRQQLACSLGYSKSPSAAEILVRLAATSNDKYLTSAALSSLNPSNLPAVVEAALIKPEYRERLAQPVLASAAGMSDADTLRRILQVLLQRDDHWYAWQYSAVARLLDGVDRRGAEVVDFNGADLQNAAQDLAKAALTQAVDSSVAEDQRLSAMSLVGRSSGPATRVLFGTALDNTSSMLAALITPQSSAKIQSAAVQAILRRAEGAGGAILLERLAASTPAVRGEIINSVLSRRTWYSAVLDAIESRQILSSDLDAAQRGRLLSDQSEEIRDRAARLLAASGNPDRQQLVSSWSDVSTLPGDISQGRAVFAKRCASCHRLEDRGYIVGPDLAALTSRSTGFLLTAILDPNRDVDGRYQGYVAVTDDGRSVTGLLAGETATSITLKEPEGRESVLLRNQLEELRATGKSAMPEGIEKDVTKQELASLIAYLQTLGPVPKSFPGNSPQVVQSDENDRITLLAATASIFGADIAFESDSPFKNIGYWHGADDRVSWALNLRKEGLLDVWLDYSCDDGSAGNSLIVEGGAQPVRYKVAGTGGWSRYRYAKAGTIRLTAGKNILTVRPADGFKGPALLDLRSITLLTAGQMPEFAVAAAGTNPSSDPAELARQILDDGRAQDQREQLIADNPQHSAAIIAAMTADMPQDETEEYRRIPWIWRVAIAAGKRNQSDEILAILEVSLPATGEPLRDWQSVVVGGGIVNGLSLTGVWPRDRLDRLIAGNNPLSARWDRSIALASTMTDNEKVRTGTRYDALRMIAMESWEERGAQISRYLAKGINDELQMGAISGMSDMPAAESGRLLLENFAHYSDYNKSMAIDAMLRTIPRTQRLLNAIEQGHVTAAQLGKDRIIKLRQHTDKTIRATAIKLLPEQP